MGDKTIVGQEQMRKTSIETRLDCRRKLCFHIGAAV